jgi:hypothetical protein
MEKLSALKHFHPIRRSSESSGGYNGEEGQKEGEEVLRD